MSRQNSAIDRLVGRIFDRGPDEQKGGSIAGRKGRGARASASKVSTSRMSRVGARHGQAIFKLITSGGTTSRSGLKGQLNYICRDDKAARIIDPSNNIESSELVTNKQLNRITADWELDWWKGTRNGQTSHMILSFPRGISIDDVTSITRDLCEEKFNSGDARFKYLAAVHDDQENHPHAHIVVNRRASDNSLFHMRPNTEHSYEGFREAMAAHAGRRGIRLDPTSRFERGITDKQPTRTEQRVAQKEGRAPQQRARAGADLQFAKNQISLARVGYEAMAVVAANADCARLERAFTEIANTLETYKGDFEMPELSADELEKFDQYTSLLNDSLHKTQALLETKSPAERVPLEVRLTKTMAAFTALNPNANYAKTLHDEPKANSIYMHAFAGDSVRWDHAQNNIETLCNEYGLDAKAVAARLETGANSQYLEHMWIQDDLRRVAKATALNLENPSERYEAVSHLTNAYQDIRQDLVARHVLRPVPELESDYFDENGQSQVTQAERSEIEDSFRRVDFNYGYADDSAAREAGKQSVQDAGERFTEFASRSHGHTVFVSELWDKSTDVMQPPVGYLPVGAREREQPKVLERAGGDLAAWEDRSADAYSLTVGFDEHQDIIRLLKQNMTNQQYNRFREGDLSAIEHVTDNKVFARQLMAEVEVNDRAHGYEITAEAELRMIENREVLAANFETDHDRDRGNER